MSQKAIVLNMIHPSQNDDTRNSEIISLPLIRHKDFTASPKVPFDTASSIPFLSSFRSRC